jgi:hypothetical protein
MDWVDWITPHDFHLLDSLVNSLSDPNDIQGLLEGFQGFPGPQGQVLQTLLNILLFLLPNQPMKSRLNFLEKVRF